MADERRCNRYVPRPIDTSGTVFPECLRELSEGLAANAHEIWAIQRLREGWHYGPYRNDKAKLHPCLVPYEALPDQEKQYDRKMVEETIRSIIALGYDIVPKTAKNLGTNRN